MEERDEIIRNDAGIGQPLHVIQLGHREQRFEKRRVILGIGDSAEGYRLVEVREFSALFARKGGAIELEVSREQSQ